VAAELTVRPVLTRHEKIQAHRPLDARISHRCGGARRRCACCVQARNAEQLAQPSRGHVTFRASCCRDGRAQRLARVEGLRHIHRRDNLVGCAELLAASGYLRPVRPSHARGQPIRSSELRFVEPVASSECFMTTQRPRSGVKSPQATSRLSCEFFDMRKPCPKTICSTSNTER
jgi:hypothetical protein